jgi:basic membrane protein A and related proteins
MNVRIPGWRVVCLVATTLAVAGCAPEDPAVAPDDPGVDAPAPADEDGELPSAAFIYVGPVGDAGWTYRHDQGRQCLEERGVRTSFVESVPETPDVAGVERDFIDQGFDMIFATAFGYQPFTQEVAQENPDIHFFGITPTVAPADNILNYYGNLWDGRYLTGLAAGAMTESNIIGFVAAQPIPTVIAGLNAFTLGVREVNPDAEVRVSWTLSWYDPPAERQAAESLVEAGADVVAQHQDTPSPVQGAVDNGAWAVGSESDMSEFGGDRYLTGTVWDWCPFYNLAVDMVVEGTVEPGEFYGGLDDGTVTITDLHPNVPDDVANQIDEARQGIIDGTFDYWEGPLLDNQGNEVVPAGETVGIDEINAMDWLVEGAVGRIPG